MSPGLKNQESLVSSENSASESINIESISIIVPAMDEQDSLPELVSRIKESCLQAELNLLEVILIDDGSHDRSWQVMEELSATHLEVKAVKLRRNFGKSTALEQGIQFATGTILITMDADLQDDPKEIPRFIERIRAGDDLVSGWKQIRNDPLEKTLPSKLFNKTTAVLTGVNLHDFNCGYKAYRREIFDSVHLYGELHRYVPVLANSLGFKIGELVVEHHPRKHGTSKYGFGRYLKGFLDLLTVLTITRFAHRPGHLFGGVGAIVLIVGGLILGYLTGLKLFFGASIGDRPLLMLGVLTVIVGVQFLLFGMLAELINSHQSEIRQPDVIAIKTGFMD
jgi:glycosyltransferase involved in cell wall biosynthesis